MQPLQPNTMPTLSQPPPPRQTCQQKPLVISIVDDSSTESESNQLEHTSPLESEPDNYYSGHRLSPPENQQGLEDWKLQCDHLHGIPEVPEPTGGSRLFEGNCPK